MRPCRLSIVLGTRPEAVKLAPVVLAARDDPRFEPTVVHTGQHQELAADVLDAFGLVADERLDLMGPGQTLGELLGRAVTEVARLLADIGPDVVVVQGDTTTAAAAALAAAQLRVPVAHVEAGLRSGDRSSPFPEEDNRRLISVVADLHLAPTAIAAANLIGEGVKPSAIVVTGNTGIDALEHVLRADADDADDADDTDDTDDIGRRLCAHPGPVALVTAHRRESWGAPLANIGRGVSWLLDLEPELLVVLPMHPNPRVRGVLRAELGGHPRALLCEPLRYRTMARALAASALALTDSGGLQEEAPHLGVPVLVLRDTTERPEAVSAGSAAVVGTDPGRIVATARAVLHDEALRRTMAQPRAIFGDGRASRRTVDALAHLVGLADCPPADFVADLGSSP
ncbi:MAG: non-hydrolyzing UDP-N-acetylglucosamine 2-epimerase [Acidimicrobiia bacterium]